PRHDGTVVLADAILTPTREPSLLSSQVQQGPGHPRYSLAPTVTVASDLCGPSDLLFNGGSLDSTILPFLRRCSCTILVVRGLTTVRPCGEENIDASACSSGVRRRWVLRLTPQCAVCSQSTGAEPHRIPDRTGAGQHDTCS